MVRTVDEIVKELLGRLGWGAPDDPPYVQMWGVTPEELSHALVSFYYQGVQEGTEEERLVGRVMGRILREIREKKWQVLVLVVDLDADWVYYEGYTPRPGEKFLPFPGEEPWEALATLEERGVRFRRQGKGLVVTPAELARDAFSSVRALVPLALSVLEDGEEVGAGELLWRLRGALSVPGARA